MAKSKPGQIIEQRWERIEGRLLSTGLLARIGDAQGEHIRLQNLSQMAQGKNRNGRSMGRYAPRTLEERRKLGLQTGKVDLRRSGGFWDSIKASARPGTITRDYSGAQIVIDITVDAKYEGRLRGFRSGNYGNRGHAIERPVIGMADRGTPLRLQQERQLRRIAEKEIRDAFRGGDVTFTTTDT